MGWLKKRVAAAEVEKSKGLPCPFLSERCPALWEFLTVTSWPDGGGRRETGSLVVFTEDGGLKACLSDRDGGNVAFVAGRGLFEILEALEAGLVGDDLDWRRAKGSRGQQSPRPKKGQG